ncbi:MAG: hypothetical protein R3A79_29410 [Nannocystaceae bacterium]
MPSTSPLLPVALFVAVFAGGCVLASPDFDGDSEAATATTTGSGGPTTTTSGAVTSLGSASESDAGTSGSASEGSTSAGTSTTTTATSEPTTTATSEPMTTQTTEPTTGDVTTGEATTGDVTTGEATTGGVDPGTYELTPEVAACVFRANANGPYSKSGCAMNASSQVAEQNLMMYDTAVGNNGGAGRRAEGYVSFAIPDAWAGATITAATVRGQAADWAWIDTPKAGDLVRTESFTGASLDASAPATIDTLDVNTMKVNDTDWVAWTVPVNLVVPGQTISLGIMPSDPVGMFLRKPTLELEVVIE